MKKIIILIGVVILIAAGIYYYLNISNNKGDTESGVIPLDIQIYNDIEEVLNPYTEILISSEKDLELEQGAVSELTFINEIDGEKYYILKVSEIQTGKSSRSYTFNSPDGGKYSTEISFDRIAGVLPSGYESIDGWEDSTYIIEPNIFSIVNKNNRLLEDYEPEGVVDLNVEYGIYTLNDAKLERDAAVQLNKMWNALGKDVEYVTVVSGYRSWQDQFRLYSGYIKTYGEKETDTFSARPGYSEHQLGTAVDFTNKEMNYNLSEDFGNTDAGKWLKENCFTYGFIPSYPKEEVEQTGYYEPWQYRYVGIDSALEFKNSGMSLTQWLNSKNNPTQ